MRDLAKILADYVDNKLDPETEIEIDGLILLYVDGELDPERAAEIKAAMEANPAVEASISHSVAAAKTVQEQLVPADDVFEMPPDPEHDKWLAELIADPNAWGKEPDRDEQANVVVPLQAPRRDEQPTAPRPTFVQPTWGAMAASIAVLLALGGGAYLYDSEGDAQREEQLAALNTEIQQLTEERETRAAESDRLTRQVTALGIQLSEATAARDDVTNQLAGATTEIDGLNADQEDLSAQLAAANDEVAAAQAARDNLEQEIASLDAETRQAVEARVAERDELTRQLTTLENRLDDATAARDNVTNQLAEATTEIEGLNADRAELAAQLADAAEGVTTAQAARDQLEERIATLDADMRQATAELVTERDALTSQMTTLQNSLAAAETARAELDSQFGEARTAIATLNIEKEAAASQRAALETERSGLQGELAAAVDAREIVEAQLTAEIEQAEERVVALENDLSDAQGQVAGLNQAGNLLLAETERLRKEGSWLNHVVGYHRGYAGSPREVEGSDDATLSEQALVSWFEKKLGRPFPVPDLDGLEFVGGRVFFVNGVATGQIAYHDRFGRLTGLCFSPAPSDQTTELQKGQDGDLNLVYWEKDGFRYVLVGWVDSNLLEPLATELRQTYGEEA